jgi:RNA polymerase sigma-70 factor (ECF subfamily)
LVSAEQTITVESVYTENVEKLYKFFYFKVLNKQTAEDLTADTFIAFAEKFNSLDKDNDTMQKYLYGIARNMWNGYLREQYKTPETLTDDIDDFSRFVEDENDEIERMSLQERAIRFINLLPPRQRIIATFRLIDGLTPTQISTKINKTVNYVKVTLRRAMRRLEELVAQARLSEEQNHG